MSIYQNWDEIVLYVQQTILSFKFLNASFFVRGDGCCHHANQLMVMMLRGRGRRYHLVTSYRCHLFDNHPLHRSNHRIWATHLHYGRAMFVSETRVDSRDAFLAPGDVHQVRVTRVLSECCVLYSLQLDRIELAFVFGFPEDATCTVLPASFFVREEGESEIFSEIGARSALDKDLVDDAVQ